MRPTDGYIEQGLRSYQDGVSSEKCPHRTGTLKNLEWAIGWNQGLLDDGLEEDDEDLRMILSALKADRRAFLHRTTRNLPSAASVADAIGIATDVWPGNCYAIASKLLESGLLAASEAEQGKARLLYGVYDGPISSGSPFAGRPVTHHGWIEFESGLVVDPTRWVFHGTEPALAAVSSENYDLAGNALRKRHNGRPAPAFDPDGRIFAWDANAPETTDFLRSALGLEDAWDRRLGFAQLIWICNLPLDELQQHAAPLYGFADRCGLSALIPIDNRNYVAENAAEDDVSAPTP